jgi:hypothetical protein
MRSDERIGAERRVGGDANEHGGRERRWWREDRYRMSTGRRSVQRVLDGSGVDRQGWVRGRKDRASHPTEEVELSTECERGDSGDAAQLQHTELVGGGRKREGSSERGSHSGLKNTGGGEGYVWEAAPEEDAIGEGRDHISLHQGSDCREVKVSAGFHRHPGDEGRGLSRLCNGVSNVGSPEESLGEVDTQILVLRGNGDGEPAQSEGLIEGRGRRHPGGEDHQLCLGGTKAHTRVIAPLVQMRDGGLELGQVLGLKGGGGRKSSSWVRTNGPIISEEGGCEKIAIGVCSDSLLEAIDEDEEEKGAEDTALRDTVVDWKPTGVLRRVHTPHAPVGEEGTKP